MKLLSRASLAAVLALVLLAGAASAQVVVRAPFVRVGVGGPGVYVRAPFVNLFVPSSTPSYYFPPGYPPPGYAPGYYGPGSSSLPPRYYGSDYTLPPLEPRFVPPAPRVVPGEPAFVPSAPKVVERPPALPPDGPIDDPKLPRDSGLSVDEFVKAFKPRAGSYELDLINPVTKRPTNVRFTLPEGMPTSVLLRGNTIEFNYGPMRFVHIAFDKDGALVTAR